jgi:nucleoside-diphosphate-sugar epimerase
LILLQAARAAQVRRLVLSSTCAVYGDDPTLPKVETMRPQPKSPYAVSKLAAEHYCQVFYEAFGLETVVLRYFNVYGPRQNPASAYSGVISIFAGKLAQGLVPHIFGDGRQTRDFVFVEDVVRANLLAAAVPQAAGAILNIGTGHPASIRQLFEILQHIFGCDLEPVYKPARNGDVLHSYANSSLAQTILGWQAQISLEAGLTRLAETYPPG